MTSIWSKTLHLLLALALLGAPCAAVCKTNADGLEKSLANADATSRQSYKAEQSVVNIKASWRKVKKFKPIGRYHKEITSTSEKETSCRGVLLADSKDVLTLADCLKSHDGFKLTYVSLSFSNGQTASGAGNCVSIDGDFALVRVNKRITADLPGLEFSVLPKDKSLQEAYGKDMSAFLISMLADSGSLSMRSSYIRSKDKLKKGDLVVYKGKLVGLVKWSPFAARLSLSALGEVSESFLAVLRMGNGGSLVK